MQRLVPVAVLALALIAIARTGLVPGAEAADPVVVCIDPGHSRLAGGASIDVKVGHGRNGTTTTLTEAEVNVDVALEVAAQLEARYDSSALQVVLTWGKDDNLNRGWDPQDGPAADDQDAVEARGEFCTQEGAALIASLHTNALNVPFNGTLTGYRDDDDLALAEIAHPMIFSALGTTADGKKIGKFRDFGLDQGDWWISLGAPDSAVAVFEPVLMTDRNEAERLLPSIADGGARRQQIADVEAAAIAAYVDAYLLGP